MYIYRFVSITVITLVISACTTTGSKMDTSSKDDPADKNASSTSIHITPKINTYSEIDKTVWMAYGMSMAYCEIRYMPVTFDFELCAREKTMEIWADLKQKKSATSEHFERLEKVMESGFIREYVWVNLYQPYWFKPDNLNVDKFENWAKDNLAGHEPNREPGVYLTRNDNTQPNNVVTRGTENSGYPNDIARFKYEGESHYSNPSLGDSIRYRDTKNPHTYLDIYLFPMPDKYEVKDSKTLLNGLFSEAKAGIIHYVNQGLYSNYSVVSEGYVKVDNSTNLLLRGVYTLSRDNAQYYSTLYITNIEGKAVKFRVTYPYNDIMSGGDHFLGIIQEAISKYANVIASQQ